MENLTQPHLLTRQANYQIAQIRVRSPKLSANARGNSRSSWYNYYAGFSVEFVEDILDQLDLRSDATILDPWLGSGTTAEIATINGYHVTGFDLNPVMLVVAKARILSNNNFDSIKDFIEELQLLQIRQCQGAYKISVGVADPLSQWFQPGSIKAFRNFEDLLNRMISKCTASPTVSQPIWEHASTITSVQAFIYVALFRTIRHFLGKFRSSNPTWIKIPAQQSRLHISTEILHTQFLKEVILIQEQLASETRKMPVMGNKKVVFDQVSSTDLPLSDDSIDLVLSSPPYCTRIDYVRATLPELAVIGFPNGSAIRQLRNKMLGTPTIVGMTMDENMGWGETCNDFLASVKQHSSKASATYYFKYFYQYFTWAFESVNEIERVLAKSGKCVFVVQNSYYKDIHNDLPAIYCDMAEHCGLHLIERQEFPVKRTMAGINPDSKRYRKRFDAIETVLTFAKS